MTKPLAAAKRIELSLEKAERLIEVIADMAGGIYTNDLTELVQLAGLLHDIGKIGFPDYLFVPQEGRLE